MTEPKKLISPWFNYSPVFLLSLLCLFLYLPALYHDFVIDDPMLVVNNPYIKSWQYLPQMLTQDAWNIWEHHNYWRPVFSLSLALDYSVWGLNPFGFHLTNVLLHTFNTLLLCGLARKWLSPTGAVLTSLFFALHPIQTHAVNVISTRGDLLATFFALLSLYAFFSKSIVPFAFSLMGALLSKETSMALPLALLSAWIILPRGEQNTRLILSFVILGLYLGIRLSLGFSFSLPPSSFSYHVSWDTRLLLVFKVLALYFVALFNLFEMPRPFWTVEIPASVGDPYVIAGILIFGLLLGAIWKSLKNNPLIAFGLSWFVIYFLPISNLKELNQPMAEHWLYMPLVGLSLAFGAALTAPGIQLSKARLLRVGVTAAVFVFLIFAALVVREKIGIYQNDETFLLAAIRTNPQIAGLYSNLGDIYLARQDVPRAREFYSKALYLDPNNFLANYRTGFLFHKAGQHDKAKTYLEKVAQSSGGRLWEILAAAHAWEMLGGKQKALFYYRKALDTYPDSVEIKQKIATLEETMPLSQR